MVRPTPCHPDDPSAPQAAPAGRVGGDLAGNRLGCWRLDGVAEGGELLDEARRSVASGPAAEVVRPEVLVEGAVAEHVVSIRSERQLVERIDFDLLFRWFVGLGVDDPVWDASTFSKNRDRLLAGEVAARFLATVLAPMLFTLGS